MVKIALVVYPIIALVFYSLFHFGLYDIILIGCLLQTLTKSMRNKK